MKTDTITIFERTYHRVTTMEQLRHQGGRAGRGRRIGLKYYVLYQDETNNRDIMLEQRITADQRREEIETLIDLGVMYLENIDYDMTMAAIEESNLKEA